MLELTVISGKTAGTRTVARRFPFNIGRSSDNHLAIEDVGVWDKHCEIVKEDGKYWINALSDAAIFSESERMAKGPIVNGAVLSIGNVRIRFELARVPQRNPKTREYLVWTGLVAITGFQMALLYWLLGK